MFPKIRAAVFEKNDPNIGSLWKSANFLAGKNRRTRGAAVAQR
jgi:hypothetical protein